MSGMVIGGLGGWVEVVGCCAGAESDDEPLVCGKFEGGSEEADARHLMKKRSWRGLNRIDR